MISISNENENDNVVDRNDVMVKRFVVVASEISILILISMIDEMMIGEEESDHIESDVMAILISIDFVILSEFVILVDESVMMSHDDYAADSIHQSANRDVACAYVMMLANLESLACMNL